MQKYCTKCGKILIEEVINTESFDKHTGKKIQHIEMKCMSGICGHDGIHCIGVKTFRTFWEFIGGWKNAYQCSKCNCRWDAWSISGQPRVLKLK